MNKKSAIVFFLVLVSVVATWLIESNKPENSPEIIGQINQLIDTDKRIKSHVWNHTNLAVGVIKEQVNPPDYARELCTKIEQLGGQGIAVQVIDVLKLQQSGGEDWEEIGYARCK